jgi:hypothetical protein
MGQAILTPVLCYTTAHLQNIHSLQAALTAVSEAPMTFDKAQLLLLGVSVASSLLNVGLFGPTASPLFCENSFLAHIYSLF